MCGIIGYVGSRACKPLLLQGLTRLEYRDPQSGTWVEVDITSVVSGDGVLSLRVTKPSGAVWYSSKEGGHAPQLVLTFVGP